MNWDYRFDPRAFKEFSKLNPSVQKIILSYLNKHVKGSLDPRLFGKKLAANFTGLWRYRVSDYRIICQFRDHELIILIVRVGHRKNIYD
ncbi:MAG: type II toxin-antitoxin system RelE/ParE family toxin [Verrucomicrobia bacterium]|nr:type II toxin-antitoxin system RelE/ParE family toxin [Verrucomicrobiota bacterium]